MREDIVTRARFLLTELHLPPVEANERLKDYFPDLELEERARYLREAGALLEETCGVNNRPLTSP